MQNIISQTGGIFSGSIRMHFGSELMIPLQSWSGRGKRL